MNMLFGYLSYLRFALSQAKPRLTSKALTSTNKLWFLGLIAILGTNSLERFDSKERNIARFLTGQRAAHTLPSRGPWGTETSCPKSAVSSPTPVPEPPSSPGGRSGSSPCRSLSRVSCGTLHPHPFISEKAVSRKPRSRPCSSGCSAWYPAG